MENYACRSMLNGELLLIEQDFKHLYIGPLAPSTVTATGAFEAYTIVRS